MDSICTNPQLQSPLNTASKDKFLMVLNLPYVLRKQATTDPSIDIEPLQISIFGAIVPEIKVPEVDVRFAGQNFHLTSYARPNYPPLDVKFVVDNEYKNYFLLWKWLDIKNLALEDYYGGSAALTPQEQAEVGNQFEYQTDISVFALNEYNEKVIEFKYFKAFVSALGSINYSYRDGELLEASAQFSFSQLDVIKHFPPSNIKKQQIL